MLPNKKYLPEDVVTIAWKRRWLILVPFVVASAVTTVVATLLPDQYRSESLMIVIPQRVPESYVKPAVRSSIQDRLQSISQQILSRTRLANIIEELGLYPEERRTMLFEDVVQQMRDDISIRVDRGDAFRVSYVSEDRVMAMRVTERVAQLFIDENLRNREIQAEGTTQFLQAQLDEARQRLIEHEKKLEAYRLAHAGELPDQLDTNLTVIHNTQSQIQSTVAAIAQDQDRLRGLEMTLADLQADPLGSMAPEAATPESGDPAARLVAARKALRSLQLRLKAEHPDVIRMKRIISELEGVVAQDQLAEPLSPEASAPTTPAEAQRQRRLRELNQQVASLKEQIGNKESEVRRLRGVMAGYQARAEAAPTRHTELIQLTRDYSTLQDLYTSLLKKSEESKMAVDLETRQIGEQFRVIDPARVAERPFSPNRPLIIMFGSVFGLGLGLALAALAEYRDNSLRTEQDVLGVLSLPVLAMIPVMTTADERARLRRKRLRMALATGVVLVAAIAAAVFVTLRS